VQNLHDNRDNTPTRDQEPHALINVMTPSFRQQD